MAESTTGVHRGKRFWFDPRFVIGLLLVVASVAGVYAVVAAAEKGVEVYVARSGLVVGQTVHPHDLQVKHVRLGVLESHYAIQGAIPEDGAVMTRTIAQGEMVPTAALGTADDGTHTTIVLTATGQLAGTIETGSVVDVWSAQEIEHGQYEVPSVLVGSARIVRIVKDDSIVAGGRTFSVEVRIPAAKTANVLEAIANTDVISLVPAREAVEDEHARETAEESLGRPLVGSEDTQ